jgi:hypothetical protein
MRVSAAGTVIARVLAGAWRAAPPPELDISAAELAAVTSLLHRSGSGALVWWRLRETRLARDAAAAGFPHAYLVHASEANIHALKIAEAFRRLKAAGVEALLVKGWAIARHYPEVGLRHYTDLDLIVPPGHSAAARMALGAPPPLDHPVDLHDGPAHLDTLSFDTLVARAGTLTLHGETVRVPAAEDHLRILALHALRHAIFRPIWLMDLAVLVETRAAGFDWVRCLGSDPRRADWVICAVALSHRLLGAYVDDTPAAGRIGTLPPWLIRAVLRGWTHGQGRSHREPAARALAARIGHPRQLWAEARSRWDRPIEATMEVGGPFNGLPRWPFQVAAVARRVSELAQALRDKRGGSVSG